eukprot:CAMPEP_0172173390 /NCGR_PEP_ID=MMETSP1050-20130122/13028_1 /TAXON_ID=233186 /ORGANISM="Cryptomonas curvata, Strain CCAP979/52" /LENGTH=207 /DNA_ID=CAMNT_0012845141 /DNA_START=403 /DNA_END=1026 /DNA_ORIENTATION=-
MWAWNQVEKENDQVKLGAKPQVIQTLLEYNDHASACTINGLIKDCSRGRSGGIDDDDMRRLLSGATGQPASPADVQTVHAKIRNICQSTHGGYSRRAATDPDILSKAVFLWWIERHPQGHPAAPHGAPPRDAAADPWFQRQSADGRDSEFRSAPSSGSGSSTREEEAGNPWTDLGESISGIWHFFERGCEGNKIPPRRSTVTGNNRF